MPEKTERRFFLCTGQVVYLSDVASDREKYAGSHIIGEVVYRLDSGKRVTALAIFENSVCADEIPPANPELVNYAFGDAREIWCRHGIRTAHRCGRKQRWEIGKAALASLTARLKLQDKLIDLETVKNETR